MRGRMFINIKNCRGGRIPRCQHFTFYKSNQFPSSLHSLASLLYLYKLSSFSKTHSLSFFLFVFFCISNTLFLGFQFFPSPWWPTLPPQVFTLYSLTLSHAFSFHFLFLSFLFWGVLFYVFVPVIVLRPRALKLRFWVKDGIFDVFLALGSRFLLNLFTDSRFQIFFLFSC